LSFAPTKQNPASSNAHTTVAALALFYPRTTNPKPSASNIEKHLELTDLVIVSFCDPSAGKKGTERLKRTSARSAIVTVGLDYLTRVFVLEAWADRCSTETLTKQLFATHERFPTMRIFGMEANAMQSLYADSVLLEARAKHKRIPFTPVTQPTKIEKHWRIRTTLQPVIANGRLFLQPDQHELQAELSSFPMTPVVDIVDALASAINIAPVRPSVQIRNDEAEAHAAYLRRCGVAPDTIQRRILELYH
jgi:muconolactone delta-isomerase